MIVFVLRRLAAGVGMLVLLIALSFGLVSMIPGDPAVTMLGDAATPDQIAHVHEQLGLDKPLPVRFWDYLVQVLHGDLGTSYFTGAPITHELLTRLPNTLVILVPGLLLAVVLGTAMGTAAAYLRGRPADRGLTWASSLILAVPEFALGLVLVYVFYQLLHLAPAPLGMVDPTAPIPPVQTGSVTLDALLSGSWPTLGSIFSHAALPILTLGIFFAAYFAKTVRTGLSQSLRSAQVEFARACGLSEFRVYRYAMADIRRSLLTYLVILFGASLSGAAILESVFAWPGIGGWSLDGVLKGDIPVIQGFVLVLGTATLGAYLVLDIVTMLMDPRVRSKARTRGKAVKPAAA
ncbi:ABC transporter permease [Amycolatopsis sp. NPDC059090]|uniref:ABC transporter permease n=1 Tax=unclassified Amycolatopsis TaxID=2618356 RepID=UPI003670284A